MNCGSKRKYSKGGETGKKDKRVSIKDFLGHPVNHLRRAVDNMRKPGYLIYTGKDEDREDEDMKTPKKMNKGGGVSDEFENSKLARDSMNENMNKKSKNDEFENSKLARDSMNEKRNRGGKPQKGYNEGGKVDVSKMTDEERYGKVGAEIRRLDPEAFKNRPKTAEGNIALLKELRAKAKGGEKAPSAPRTMSAEEFGSMTRVNPRPAPPRPAPSAPRSAGQRPVPKGRGDRTSSSGLTVREARIAAGKESPFDRRSMMGTAASRREAIAQGYDRKPRREAIEKGREALGKRVGGAIKKYAAGGAVRGDGICRVKTKGRMR